MENYYFDVDKLQGLILVENYEIDYYFNDDVQDNEVVNFYQVIE